MVILFLLNFDAKSYINNKYVYFYKNVCYLPINIASAMAQTCSPQSMLDNTYIHQNKLSKINNELC